MIFLFKPESECVRYFYTFYRLPGHSRRANTRDCTISSQELENELAAKD